MQHFGVSHHWDNQIIEVAPQKYRPNTLTVESDWSSASYWYSLAGLSGASVTLNGLHDNSLQGDRAIADIMSNLGVDSSFSNQKVVLKATAPKVKLLEADFSQCPDLAQTVLSYCAIQGISCKLTGLESLRIKETDRIMALQKELAKVNAKLTEHEGVWELTPGEPPTTITRFESYEDHRMAMALAPLAIKLPVVIDDPKVVRKSYPGYWTDLLKLGIQIDAIA
jgi:3-phosphoshikimate 1-carboxyvinyltransferase